MRGKKDARSHNPRLQRRPLGCTLAPMAREALTGSIGAGLGIKPITVTEAIRNLEKALDRGPSTDSLARKMLARIDELQKPGARVE